MDYGTAAAIIGTGMGNGRWWSLCGPDLTGDGKFCGAHGGIEVCAERPVGWSNKDQRRASSGYSSFTRKGSCEVLSLLYG